MVSLPDVQAFVGFATALARPDFVTRSKYAERPCGNLRRCAAQGVSAAAWARFARRFAGCLLASLERSNTGFQVSYAFRGLRQRFPNRRFIKDFQNV